MPVTTYGITPAHRQWVRDRYSKGDCTYKEVYQEFRQTFGDELTTIPKDKTIQNWILSRNWRDPKDRKDTLPEALDKLSDVDRARIIELKKDNPYLPYEEIYQLAAAEGIETTDYVVQDVLIMDRIRNG